jgi:hypothetical protein
MASDELDLISTYALRCWLRGDEIGLDVLRRSQAGDLGAAEALAAELLELADELADELFTSHVLSLWVRGDEVGLHVVRRACNGDDSATETIAFELLELADELGPDLYRRYLADEIDAAG